MEKIKISPSALGGKVTAPPSKSAAHRMILCAALSQGHSLVSPACHSADIDATINAARALGAKINEQDGAFSIYGISKDTLPKGPVTIDCGESGSTLRFLIPIAAALGVNATFIGHGRLPNRPIDELTSLLSKHGVLTSDNKLPLTISGKLKAGEYLISGNVSSQYLTGLLLALPLAQGDAKITLTTKLESAGYVDMTIDALKQFGVDCNIDNFTYKANGTYTPKNAVIEGDWSQACFFLAAAALSSKIEILGLNPNSLQGDKAALEIFKDFGLSIENNNGTFTVARNKSLSGSEIDCSQIPDMVPALAVTAALCEGTTRIFGAERLRIKESDRIKTTLDGLLAMGVDAKELPDGLQINGGNKIRGAEIDGANDHRIVMAFSVLAAAAKGDTIISGYSAINKSYPDFFKDYIMLGGKADVI